MKLIQQQEMILKDYQKRVKQLEDHKGIWQGKVNELNEEIKQCKTIMEVIKKTMKRK